MHRIADMRIQLGLEDTNFDTSLCHHPLSGLDLSMWSKLCEFATNKECYSMKGEMASDEKCPFHLKGTVALSLSKLFVLSAEKMTPPTSPNAF